MKQISIHSKDVQFSPELGEKIKEILKLKEEQDANTNTTGSREGE